MFVPFIDGRWAEQYSNASVIRLAPFWLSLTRGQDSCSAISWTRSLSTRKDSKPTQRRCRWRSRSTMPGPSTLSSCSRYSVSSTSSGEQGFSCSFPVYFSQDNFFWTASWFRCSSTSGPCNGLSSRLDTCYRHVLNIVPGLGSKKVINSNYRSLWVQRHANLSTLQPTYFLGSLRHHF